MRRGQGDQDRSCEPSPIDLAHVQQLAVIGSNRQQIATLLDIDECALNEADTQRFEAAFQQGRTKGVAVVFDALMRNATAGDPRAVALVREEMIEPQANERESAPLVIKLAGVQCRHK